MEDTDKVRGLGGECSVEKVIKGCELNDSNVQEVKSPRASSSSQQTLVGRALRFHHPGSHAVDSDVLLPVLRSHCAGRLDDCALGGRI